MAVGAHNGEAQDPDGENTHDDHPDSDHPSLRGRLGIVGRFEQRLVQWCSDISTLSLPRGIYTDGPAHVRESANGLLIGSSFPFCWVWVC